MHMFWLVLTYDAPRVPLLCSYHILMSSVIYYWTDAQQLGIYLLNSQQENLGPMK